MLLCSTDGTVGSTAEAVVAAARREPQVKEMEDDTGGRCKRNGVSLKAGGQHGCREERGKPIRGNDHCR